MDADVVIVGAGPTGLMLACEVCRAGVRPLVLERQPQIRDIPKAGGLSGQILELLRFRGELERFEAAGTAAIPATRLPWGGMHVDFTQLADPPMEVLPLPQPQLERVLDDFARELGAEIRRGGEVVGLSQDDDTVTADVRGSDGPTRVTARYLVGCDGASSRVRDLAGIPFPGITYPEVQRLAQVTVPEGVTVLENGDIDVAGHGRIPFGFTRTERGEFALGSTNPGLMGLYTSEEEEAVAYDDDEPMTVTELRDSLSRVLGVDLPLGEPTRLTRFTFHARQVERYRDGRILMAGDAAHLFPSPGVALGAGLLDSVNLGWKLAADVQGWAPDGLLDTYQDERRLACARTMLHAQAQVAIRRGHDPAAVALRELFQELLVDEQPVRRLGGLMAGSEVRYPFPGHDHHALIGTFAPDLGLRTDQGATSVAELMRTARPVFLNLADRPDLREIAREWQDRVDIHTAETDHRPVDALLIRPDVHVAWAATIDEPTDSAAAALRDALSGWFGTPAG
jgi:2-polyprenyl-6-methoxyphenol hydroxylase-like FAD-dependent oxidoreductase